MKILIITIVSLNPGDAAILLGTIKVLRSRYGDQIEVVAVDRSAREAEMLYPWVRFVPSLFQLRENGVLRSSLQRIGYAHLVDRLDRLRWFAGAHLLRRGWNRAASVFVTTAEARVLREYLSADLVLASGGTYLVPEYHVEPALLEYELVIALGLPFGVLPQSLGPFAATGLAGRFHEVFQRAEPLCVRDPQSVAHLRAIGVLASRIKQVPDVAFSFACIEQKRGVGSRSPFRQGVVPRVAISVRECARFFDDPVQGESAYLDALVGLVRTLVVEHDASVVFVSSCQGVTAYRTDDSEYAKQVVERLPDELRGRVRVDQQFRGPEDLVAELKQYDLVVATRMHMAILSLCAGTPAVAVAYEFKTEELYRRLGVPELCVPLAALSPRALVDVLGLMVARWPELVEQMVASTVALSREARAIEYLLPSRIG